MYAEIIPAKRSLPGLPFFSYKVDPKMEREIEPGSLVKIPFRNGSEFGVVRNLSSSVEFTGKNIKSVTSVIHKNFICKETINFLEEIALLYHSSLGSLIKSSLPPLQSRKISKLPKLEEITNRTRELKKPNVFIYKNSKEKKEFFKSINLEGQTLILVPEAEDLSLIFSYLDEEQKMYSIIISSYLSEKEMFSAWVDVWSNKKKIIIGTRRALFLSFFDLRKIIIDSEGHTSHKSWDSAPRIHTKDAALIASKHYKAELYFISHSPSVETYFFTKKEVYKKISQSYIPQLQNIPQIVNMKKEPVAGNYGPISFPLQEALLNHNQGNIFLFCNRKGTSSYVSCRDCGTVMKCRKCGRPSTYHESSCEIVCHHCNIRDKMLANCLKCGGVNLAKFGAGTDMIYKEVKKLLPQRDIVQIESSDETLKKIDPKIDQIIVGTQFAWPFINWEKTYLMAFIDADTPLFVPEYHTSENVWQSIFDASFRLPKNAEFIIQTSHPDHNVYNFLIEPGSFYEIELKERKLFGYPPFNFILKLFLGAPTKDIGKQESLLLKRKIDQLTKTIPDIKITQPIELFPPFKNGKYWQALIVKLPYKNYKFLSKEVLKLVPDTWKVDPNPNTLLSM